MTTFQELLSRNADDIKEPQPVPPGHYRGVMTKYDVKEFNKNNPKQGESPTYSRLVCTIIPTEPCSDVNPEALAAYNEAGDLTKEELEHSFAISEKSLFYIKEWLSTACACAPGQTLMEMLIQAQGKQGLVFEVQHGISKRTSRPYATIGNFLPFGTAL
jgi:hypothetical protein